jgi:uncharacterized membrane-anchored protein YjiN (DUF445 family)
VTMSHQVTPRRIKSRFAAGLLLISAGGFLAALWTGSPVVLAMATGALVGGFTDWFAVEALFRRLPLPRAIASNIVIMRRTEITQALTDLVDQKVLPREGMAGLLDGVSASERIDQLLEDAEARASLELLITDTSRRLVCFAEPEGLAQRLAEILRSALDTKEALPFLVTAARTARRSPDLGRFLDRAARELRFVAGSAAFRNFLDQIFRSALRSYSTEGLAKKISAAMGQAARGQLVRKVQTAFIKHLGTLESDGILRRRLLSSLDTWLDELEGDSERRRDLERRLQCFVEGPAIEKLLDRSLAALRDGLLAPDTRAFKRFSRWIRIRSTEAWRTFSDRGRETLDVRVRGTALSLAERHHDEIGRRVSEMMARKSDEELVTLLRNEVGDDLASIRITGTILGCLLGAGIFALTLAPPWALWLLPLASFALTVIHLRGEHHPKLSAWRRRRFTADLVLSGAALFVAASPLVDAGLGATAGAIAFVIGEAGFVAGCADLFAITALFRKIPLIPGRIAVPHTGVIHAEHDKIGSGLAALLQREVFPPEKIRELLDERDLVLDLLGFIGENPPERRRRLRELMIALPRAFRDGDSRSLAAALQKAAFERLRLTPLAPQARALVQYGLKAGWTDDILDRAVTVALEHCERPGFESELRDLLEREARAPRSEHESLFGFSVKWIARQAAELSGGLDYTLMAQKLSAEICTELRALQGPGHQLRTELEHSLGELSLRLSHDEGFSEALETWKRGFLDRMDVADWLSGRFERLALAISEDTGGADWLADQLSTLMEHLQQMPSDRENLNRALRGTATVALERLMDLAPTLIQEQFQRNLPADQLVEFVRERLGSDLQGIRINGTAIGAGVGGVLGGVVFVARLVLG